MREELVKQLTALRKQEDEIRKQIEKYDYDNKFSKVKVYLGKYYKETGIHHDDENNRCLYVYDINKESCELQALSVHYWTDNDTYFGIEYYAHFNPERWDENDNWEEITKEEYLIHYNHVQEMVKNINK